MNQRRFKKPYKPRFASRKDYSHHKTFGAAPAGPLPDELLKLPPLIYNQGSTPSCTAAASCTARSIMTGKTYDVGGQWALELHYKGVSDADGFPLDVPAEVGKKVGFSITGETAPADKVGGCFWINSKEPGKDWFDTVRSRQYQLFLQTGKVIPLQFGINWYSSWDLIPDGRIPLTNEDLLGGHDSTLAGWKTIPGGIPLIANPNSWGTGYGDNGVFWFDRAAFNKNVGALGMFYWLDAEDMPNDVKRLGLIAQILQNIKAIYQLLVNDKNSHTNAGWPPPQPEPKPVPQPPSQAFPIKIILWARGVEKAEGANPKFNNPGNLKISSLTKSWGAKQGFNATDGGNIASFATYQMGFNALCNFLVLGAEDQLKAFHQARTLERFSEVYANPPSGTYAMRVAQVIGCTVDTDVSEFLT